MTSSDHDLCFDASNGCHTIVDDSINGQVNCTKCLAHNCKTLRTKWGTSSSQLHHGVHGQPGVDLTKQ